MSARPGHAPIVTAAPIDEARLRDLREMRAEHPDVADILVDPDGAMCTCGHVVGDHSHRGHRECGECPCRSFSDRSKPREPSRGKEHRA